MIKILALVILLSPFASAMELLEVNTSARALGMGNAYTAIVADKDALFYNPARLANIKGINLTIFDPYIGADGQDVYDTYTDFNDSTSSANQFATQLKRLYGRKVWIGGGAKAALAVPNFAIAGYDAFSGSAVMHNPAFPNLDVNFANDYGLAGGFAFNLAPGLNMGFVGRRITRVGAQFPLGVSTLALLSSTALQDRLNNRGTGYAMDWGLSMTVPTPVEPTFTFVWKQVGYTTFTQEFGSTAPPMMKDEMIAGIGLAVKAPLLTIRPAADFKYLNNTKEQLGKKLHFGLELDFSIFKLRTGLYQGYYTAGVGVDIGLIKVDAATYGVEMGVYPGQLEDRRYVIQATLELGFDPSFGFLGGGKGGKGGSGGGGGGALKQRR